MVLILSLLGIAMAAAAWENVHPIVGIVVGILFIGGFGWKALGFLLSVLFRPREARAAYGREGREFIAAWEEIFGAMRPGVLSTLPPPGIFEVWRSENRATGVSANAWLRERTR